MDDLQRAIKWLEEEEKRATANIKAMPAFNNLFIQHQKNCRALLDTLRWVPVSEKPKEHGAYLVYVADYEESGWVYSGCVCKAIYSEQFGFSPEWHPATAITHWMRLPPKPEGRG